MDVFSWWVLHSRGQHTPIESEAPPGCVWPPPLPHEDQPIHHGQQRRQSVRFRLKGVELCFCEVGVFI